MINTYIQGEQTVAGNPARTGVIAAQGTLATPGGAGISAANLLRIINVLGTGRYNAAGVVLADGQGAELQQTAAGALIVATGAAPIIVVPGDLIYAGTAAAGGAQQAVVSAATQVLVGMTFRNVGAVLGYLYIWNLAAVPGPPPLAAASSVGPYRVPPNTEMSVGFGDGVRFNTGICWASSTTDQNVYTAAGAPNMLVTTVYR